MMNKMQTFRNCDGLDLLTGAPNERSLRIWMNNVIEPQRISKRPAIDFDVELSTILGGVNLQDEWQQQINSSTIGPVQTNTGPRESAYISVFDAKAPERKEIRVESEGIKSIVAVEGTKEVMALFCNGKVGLIADRVNGNVGIDSSLKDDLTRTTTSPSLFSWGINIQQKHKEHQGIDTNPELHGEIKKEEGPICAVLRLDCPPQLECKGNERWFFGVPRFQSVLPVETVVCGEQHVCLVTDVVSGRKLFTWGSNLHGQCGLPSTTSKEKCVPSPTRVPGVFEGVVAIGCGPDYTCCVSSNDMVLSLFSFGGGYSNSRFSSGLSLFKRAQGNDGLVPHAGEESTPGPVSPLIQLQPSGMEMMDKLQPSTLTLLLPSSTTSNSTMMPRPYIFWTESLSEWVESVDDDWTATAAVPLRRLDVPKEDEHATMSVEIDNARNRLARMQSALDFDISRCALFPPGEFFDDPAPFEIRRILTNVQFELAGNQAHLELMKDKPMFEADRRFLEEERQKVEEGRIVYERLQQMWTNKLDDTAEDSGAQPQQTVEDDAQVREEGDRDVLYALLEDCRRSDLSFLARQDDFVSRKQDLAYQTMSNSGAPLQSLFSKTDESIGRQGRYKSGARRDLFRLLDRSDDILAEVQAGLNQLKIPANEKQNSFASLHKAVTLLYEKKVANNQTLRKRLSSVTDSLSREVTKTRDSLLEDSSANEALDLSHVTAADATLHSNHSGRGNRL